jgi:putative nucleotidyltransferase with HDIG domain
MGKPFTISPVLDYKKKIYDIRDLPTLPVIAKKIMSLADDESLSAEKLAAIISSDQALSTRVLSLANPAYYGHPATISTVQRAMTVVGMKMVKQVSLSVLVCGTIGRGGKGRTQFWKHSFGTAMAAALVAQRTGRKDNDVCFMAGLLHDIGKMILEMHFPNETEMDHAEVGAFMAERWQLPPALISAIGYHHSLLPEHLSQPIVACVHAADVCAKVVLSSEGAEIETEVLRALHLSQDDFFDMGAELRRRRAQIDSFLM